MTFTQSFTVRLRESDPDECVTALLDVASASDFSLKLMRKCGCAVDYVTLPDCDRKEIASWVNERVEEFAAYERDQRLEMFQAAQMHRWFKGEDDSRGGVA